MHLTSVVTATLVACSGFAAAAPTQSNTTSPSLFEATPATIADDAFEDPDSSQLAKRDWTRKVRYCEGKHGNGVCLNKFFRPSTGCYNFSDWFNDKVSSIYLEKNTWCALFVDTNCRGKWTKVFDPGNIDLKATSEVGGRVSSIKCYAGR